MSRLSYTDSRALARVSRSSGGGLRLTEEAASLGG